MCLELARGSATAEERERLTARFLATDAAVPLTSWHEVAMLMVMAGLERASGGKVTLAAPDITCMGEDKAAELLRGFFRERR